MEEKSVCSKLRHGEDGGRRVADINRGEGEERKGRGVIQLNGCVASFIYFYTNIFIFILTPSGTNICATLT